MYVCQVSKPSEHTQKKTKRIGERERTNRDRERIDAKMEYMYLSNVAAIRNTPTLKMTTERMSVSVYVLFVTV